MFHVPDRWLNKLHLLYVVFSALTIVAYAVFNFVPALQQYDQHVGTSPLFFILPGLLIIYHFSFYPLMKKRNAWIATWISYLMLTVFLILIFQPTGDYSSPYGWFWTFVGFSGGMLGFYAAAFPVLILFVGTIFEVNGTYPRHSSFNIFLLASIGNLAGFVLGWVVWRNFYIKKDESAVTASPFLQDEILKSDFILGAMTDGVILVDNKQTIVTFNKAAAEITGWAAADAIGLNYNSVLQFVDEKGHPLEKGEDIIAIGINDGKPHVDNNALILSKSKLTVSVSMSVSPLLDEQQQMTGLLVVFRDVSKEKQAQQRTADFISTASHEMRTPVAAIEGYLSLALNDKVATIDSRARGFLDKAHTSTQSLGKLFQDLLTSAKADDGRLSNHPTIIEMTSYLDGIANDFRFSAQKKGLNVEFNMGSDEVIDATRSVGKVKPLYYVYADPDRLREVITNLFDNAVKYTDQGKIIIGLTADINNVQFYIKDTGAGIPSEDIPHLFQKFYRVDNSATRSIGGTGLGLFISSKIVELYQGRIWVESELGKGSTFFVNLPRIDNKRAAELANSATAGMGMPSDKI